MIMTNPIRLACLIGALAAAPALQAQASDYSPRAMAEWQTSNLLDPDQAPLNQLGDIPAEAVENPEWQLDLTPDNPDGAASLQSQRLLRADALELWQSARPDQQEEIRIARRTQYALLSTYEKHRVRTQWQVRWQSMPAHRRALMLTLIEQPRYDRDVARGQQSVAEYTVRRENPPGPKLHAPNTAGPVLYKPRLIYNNPGRRGGLDPYDR
jgi:hypothetical protein